MNPLLTLPSELTIYTASETRTEWLAWLATLPETAEVDGSEVDEIDGAGLQLLAALQVAVRAHGHAWSLLTPSTTLSQACSAMGVMALLSDGTTTGEHA